MRIFFFADYCIPIHARSLEERPLGGTETGLIRVAEILHRRGHEVKVFTSHSNPPVSTAEYPQYLPSSALHLSGESDIFVVVQNCSGIFQQIQTQSIIYWTGDGPEQFTTFGIGDKRFSERVNLVFAVSDWHKQILHRMSGIPLHLIEVIRNGIHLDYFSQKEIRKRQRLIFTSAPHRGALEAIKIAEMLKAKFPALELRLFSGFDLYDRETPFSGSQRSIIPTIQKRVQELPFCTLHSPICQRDLAKEYLQSGIFIYPATVPETSCITAIEAKAAGCPAVVSSLGALPETVGEDGVVVKGDPTSNEFITTFANETAKLLQDDTRWNQISERAQKHAQENYDWNAVADRFLMAVKEKITSR